MDKKERLKQLRKELGFSKDGEFAKTLGISPSNLSNWYKRGSFDVNLILRKFPSVNENWLLSGEGKPLQAVPDKPHQKTIRYWIDADATCGNMELFEDGLTTNHIDLQIPEFRDCTDAVNIYGDSMYPRYKSGQIIILKEWTESYIDYGHVYLIITRTGHRMVKYLKRSEKEGEVLCVSENPAYDSFALNLEDILRLFLVKGAIEKSSM